MRLEVAIEKRHLFLFAAILVGFLGVVFVIAYNSGGPASTFGHSADELELNGLIKFYSFAPGTTQDTNTGISTANYVCGIVGGEVSGDINEFNSGSIYDLKMYESGGTWWILSHFRTQSADIWSEVKIICVDKRIGEGYL